MLTNNSDLCKELEKKLAEYLGVKFLSVLNNATTALIIAQKALGFKGEVITSPYSFIATTHSIKWNGYKPVFVDTDKHYGNILVSKVSEAINKNTGGILATHNYGFPGELEKMEKLSKKNNIPLLYDGAPSIGVNVNGKSILLFGDMSVLSFHATKIFTTFEGAAIISKNQTLKNRVDKLRNFFITGNNPIPDIGINGKMNEASAAMGLLQLKYLDKNISKRKKIFKKYCLHFSRLEQIRCIPMPSNLDYNYSYFPIFFNKGFHAREKMFRILLENDIVCRRYWYPLISSQPVYKNEKNFSLDNALALSESVICLPIYPDLTEFQTNKIIKIIIENQIS